MRPQDSLKEMVSNHLKKGVIAYLESEPLPLSITDLKIRIEYSRNENYGDYSTSFILENKKNLPGNPEEIGQKLISLLHNPEMFSEVSFTRPGFLNFRISYPFLIGYINETILNESSGGPQIPHTETPEKILFEFVSANPTGPLNIVSARAAATGDSICNLLQKIGHQVEREFYVNDFGNQVNLLGISSLCRLREHLGQPIQYQEKDTEISLDEVFANNILPYEGYRGKYLKTIVASIYQSKQQELDTLLSDKKYQPLAQLLGRYTVEENLKKQQQDLESFSVKFDNFYRESTLHENNKVLEVLTHLEKDLEEQDGKKLFLSSRYGDDKDRVVVRKDGRPTYLLADIAYHKEKMTRGFDKMINIWGPDHHGYIARLHGAMLSLGYPHSSFQVLISQQVNMLARGEKLKMSKRLGQFQTMSDLLEYLGDSARDVGRYFFVMRTLEAPLDFDLELARDNSDKNPVFYLQYAHARICSIFRETQANSDSQNARKLAATTERHRLAFWLARFSEEVYDAAMQMEPHRLANYLQSLSKTFTRFYSSRDNRIKDSEAHIQSGLSFLAEATRICLAQGLKILGVSAPQRLEKE